MPAARQDLRHLRDVAEHVRQVADGHRAAEVSRGRPAHLQVAHDGLAGAEELVEQDEPRPDGDPAIGDQGHDAIAVLRSHLQVVLDRGHLTVDGEPEVRVRLGCLQHGVESGDKPVPEHLERLVPFPVPMEMGHEDGGVLHSARDLLLAGDVGGKSAGVRSYLREPEASPVRQNRWRRMKTMITGTIETSEPVITDS